jgi:hypothetical protein
VNRHDRPQRAASTDITVALPIRREHQEAEIDNPAIREEFLAEFFG